MASFDEMTDKMEKQPRGVHYVRMALIISGISLALSIGAFWMQNVEYMPVIVSVVAIGAMVNAIMGLSQRENPFIGSTAIIFALTAIGLQFWLIALITLVIFILLVGLLSFLGVSF